MMFRTFDLVWCAFIITIFDIIYQAVVGRPSHLDSTINGAWTLVAILWISARIETWRERRR